MKFRKFLLTTAFLTTMATAAFGQSVIVTDTASWRAVPITIDSTANTYTVSGTMPTGVNEYYYSYPGHRCFVTQREVVGVNAVILKAGVSGGSDIYCYPE